MERSIVGRKKKSSSTTKDEFYLPTEPEKMRRSSFAKILEKLENQNIGFEVTINKKINQEAV